MVIDDLPHKILGVYKLKRAKKYGWRTSGRNFAVLSYRTDGEGTRFTWNENGKEKTAFAGKTDVGYFPCSASYSQESGSEEIICIHYATDGNGASRNLGFPQFEFGAVELGDLFENIYSVYAKKEMGYETLGMSILFKIFYRLTTRRPDLPERIKAVIDESFTDPDFSVASVARRMDFSETYVRRLFKARFGLGMSDYLISLRLDAAASMLASGYYTVKEVAYACGYSDPKYFSTVFGRGFGMKPTEYAAKTKK